MMWSCLCARSRLWNPKLKNKWTNSRQLCGLWYVCCTRFKYYMKSSLNSCHSVDIRGFFFSSLLNVTIELSISSLFPTIPSSRASSLQYAPLPPWSFSPCSYTSFGCVVVYILNNLPPPSSPPLQVAGFHRIV